MNKTYIVRSYCINEELYKKLKIYAATNNMTISKVIENGIKKIVK